MNTELLFQIAGIGIIVSIFHTMLKQAGKEEQGHLVTLVGVVIVLMWVIKLVADLFTTVRTVFRLY